MTPDHVIELLQRMLSLGVTLAAPLLGAGLAVGLVVAVFQAATQIQESALGFVPKLLAIGATLALMGPWALQELTAFTQGLFSDLVHLGGAGL